MTKVFSFYWDNIEKYKVFDIRIQFATWLLHSMFVQKDYKLSYDFLLLAFVVVLDHHNSFEVFSISSYVLTFFALLFNGKMEFAQKKPSNLFNLDLWSIWSSFVFFIDDKRMFLCIPICVKDCSRSFNWINLWMLKCATW